MLKSDIVENITVVVLKARNETYLFNVAEVKEIYVPGKRIVPIPLADKTIVGIIDIRGIIYSILSLRHVIYRDGAEDYNLGEKSRIILAELGGLNIAILVDSVIGVRQLPISIFDLNNVIVETSIDYKFIESIGVINSETFILLDLKAIIQPFIGFIEKESDFSPAPKIPILSKIPSENELEGSLLSSQEVNAQKSLRYKPRKVGSSKEEGILLSKYQQDTLKEIGNIGSGNAVTALSRLIKRKIDVDLTDVGIITFDELSMQFGKSDEKVCGIFCNIEKPSKSTILQVFDMNPLLKLIAGLAGKKSKIDPNKVKSKNDLDKLAISTILEMGNIMAGHYASALGDLTGMRMMIDVPEFTMSTAGKIGDFLSTELRALSKYILIIKTSINIVDLKLNGIFFFIPELETLEKIFKKLEITEKVGKPGRRVRKPRALDVEDIQLSELQKDALMEVGNIGAGNAANALAKMINKRVDINIPSVEMVELDVFSKKLSKKNEKILVAWSNVTGRARATVLTLFTVKNILKITSILIEDKELKQNLKAEKIKNIMDFPEFYRSAISELGHILASHYTSALGDLLSIRFMTEAPDMSIDNGKQLFNILKDEIGLLKKLSLVITTNVIIKDIRIQGTFLFIPELGTLNELLESLAQFYE